MKTVVIGQPKCGPYLGMRVRGSRLALGAFWLHTVVVVRRTLKACRLSPTLVE